MSPITRRTNINMPQKGPVHGRGNGVGRVWEEQHTAPIVTLVERRQDVGGVVGPVAVCPDGAGLGPRRRAGDGHPGLLGRRGDVRTRRVVRSRIDSAGQRGQQRGA